MRIKVHRSAKVDLLDGKLFYDNQQLGLGDYFESSLESDIESLKLYAGIHPKHRGFNKALSERFPYSIYLKNAPPHASPYPPQAPRPPGGETPLWEGGCFAVG